MLSLTHTHIHTHTQAVYGVLSSIEGYDTFSDMLKHTEIGPWYFATQRHVKRHESASYGSNSSVKGQK